MYMYEEVVDQKGEGELIRECIGSVSIAISDVVGPCGREDHVQFKPCLFSLVGTSIMLKRPSAFNLVPARYNHS